ncbi:DUF4139 domain-containing protein [Altererythrobacter lutimaris]|uniref:DUF4139 domain-containing protein n=1 Tax=Altererythrobacter lutimaris TaxID=2743979 RepID=A0A850HBX2_9SPHN|nr:hypothetical protein [Altererythrobacter lutimaris]NVE94088.1 hypothetical protein [Altererythrobacter lutimaris]
MTRFLLLFDMLAAALLNATATVHAREVVDASPPINTAVTVYRDPSRDQYQSMNLDLPQGFAMISETRRVTLPAGVSTIRFTGVAEGMVAVSAIVTGLPGGTIEKNRNAELLSPAALVNGMLGNRITVTRTTPGTGEEVSENGIVRTRADGGLVLQTSQGYEAVRCAGLPERLTFPAVPDGLSAQPVFTIDTRDQNGGTYDITLSYLAWGFDWQAHYVATLIEGGTSDNLRFNLLSWLTLLNDNGQTFADAELMAVAGTLNVESDFQGLAEPPRAEPLRLTCYPIGSTAAGSPLPGRYDEYDGVAPAPMAALGEQRIMVTASRRKSNAMESMADVAMVASEEALGDLKLYRVPEPVSVNAQGLKQVAFLNKQDVKGEILYQFFCDPWGRRIEGDFAEAGIVLKTKNDEKHGLGIAMPMGGITVFEPSASGELLVGEERLRDYAVGQDIEIEIGPSAQVQGQCGRMSEFSPSQDGERPWVTVKANLSNANPHKVSVRLDLGVFADWEVKGLRKARLKDGNRVVEVSIPRNGTREISFQMRLAEG